MKKRCRGHSGPNRLEVGVMDQAIPPIPHVPKEKEKETSQVKCLHSIRAILEGVKGGLDLRDAKGAQPRTKASRSDTATNRKTVLSKTPCKYANLWKPQH
ncbi:hypothetical protein V6N12_036922 [Hibiscus sabdariffa]|uniref:Uncharacterized protein n=1 Tax=Hibiscus sabdariffa TaxID=183260 RepID=A0ABR1Z6R7_9ROSI